MSLSQGGKFQKPLHLCNLVGRPRRGPHLGPECGTRTPARWFGSRFLFFFPRADETEGELKGKPNKTHISNVSLFCDFSRWAKYEAEFINPEVKSLARSFGWLFSNTHLQPLETRAFLFPLPLGFSRPTFQDFEADPRWG